MLLDYSPSMKLPDGSLVREGSEVLKDHKECVGGMWVFQSGGLREVCHLGGDAKESHTLISILHMKMLT